MDTKIKSDNEINISKNIYRIRKERKLYQTDLVRLLHQLKGIKMTREMLVKIECGYPHITASQLQGIHDCLETTYDELFK